MMTPEIAMGPLEPGETNGTSARYHWSCLPVGGSASDIRAEDLYSK
jgi:hypothetical protein